MGKRKSEQAPMWLPTTALPVSPGHPFYVRLNAILDGAGFDRFAEEQCRAFYAAAMGRPSLPPGRYFRLLLLGYFEGLDSERGIAWRAADSLAVRSFVGLGLDEAGPDHSTISRTRRLIDVETHRAVFTWVQERLVAAELLKGRTVAIDATTLEANAAMRSIVRRDTGESYQEFLTRLAVASGLKTPTREALARLDRRRKKRTSNKDWQNPFDPDAKITKMKDGRTHLAHKAEHAVDLDSGALVAVTLQGADVGDTTSLVETAIAAAEQVEAAHAASATPAELTEIIADKGYHSNQTMIDLAAVGVRSYIAEPERGRRDWARRRRRRGQCTAIAGGSAAPAANGSCGVAANTSSAPSPTYMTPAGYVALTCAAIRTSSRGCSCTRARSTSGCSCGKRSDAGRRAGGKEPSATPQRWKLHSQCSSHASGSSSSVSGASRDHCWASCPHHRLPSARAERGEFNHGLLRVEAPHATTAGRDALPDSTPQKVRRDECGCVESLACARSLPRSRRHQGRHP
jgi:transposase